MVSDSPVTTLDIRYDGECMAGIYFDLFLYLLHISNDILSGCRRVVPLYFCV